MLIHLLSWSSARIDQVGPLQWHDGSSGLLRLTVDELLELVAQFGFELKVVRRLHRVPYLGRYSSRAGRPRHPRWSPWRSPKRVDRGQCIASGSIHNHEERLREDFSDIGGATGHSRACIPPYRVAQRFTRAWGDKLESHTEVHDCIWFVASLQDTTS